MLSFKDFKKQLTEAEYTPDISTLKKIHKTYMSWKKADTQTLLRNYNSMSRVQSTVRTMGEAGGKEAVISTLIDAEFRSKDVSYYWDMSPKDRKALSD